MKIDSNTVSSIMYLRIGENNKKAKVANRTLAFLDNSFVMVG